MAETEQTQATQEVESDEIDTATYKPPPHKSLKEIQELDKDDESLIKYKKSLLGDDADDAEAVTGEGPKVELKELALMVDDHDAIVLDLTGDLAELKKKPFTVKEGVVYRAKLTFEVQNDIVSGLKYVQTTYRSLLKCDTSSYMLGSYGPKKEPLVYTAPVEEFAKGLIARGHYTVQSKFMDDDGRDFLSWEWSFNLKSDWD